MHMVLNHTPAVCAVGALLLLAWGLLRQNHRIAAVALFALAVTGLLAIPVYVAGTRAAEAIGGGPELERHRESAVAALIGLEAAAATAIAALIAGRSRRKFPVFQAAATLIIGLAALALLIRAASLGGEVRLHGMSAATIGSKSP